MAESKTKKYTVVSPVMYKKKRYEIGKPVEMEKEFGDPLVEKGVLKDFVAEPEEEKTPEKTEPETKPKTKAPKILDRDK